MDVGTTAVPAGIESGLIQNLGPDLLYVGGSDVTTDNGLEVSVNGSVVVGVWNLSKIYVVSVGSSDVRTLDRGMGIFFVPPASD